MTYEIPIKDGNVDLYLIKKDVANAMYSYTPSDGDKILQALVNHTIKKVVERLEKANNIAELLAVIRAMKEEE